MSWPPRTVDELTALVSTVAAHESAVLEVKRELPPSKKNLDIAIDVCAMTVDGGVIVYGVDETPEGLRLSPFGLAGERERISDVVSSSIAEPPEIEVIELHVGPERGFIVVSVAQSARAPHMVQVKGTHRYYGRHSGGNRLLSEGEVARLYVQRNLASPRTEDLANRLIETAPRASTPQTYGSFHLLVRPAIQHSDFLDRAWGPTDAASASTNIFKLTQQAVGDATFAERWAPNLMSAAGGSILRDLDGWLFRRLDSPGQGSDLAIGDTGDVRVWIERGAADPRNDQSVFTLRDGAIAQLTTQGLALAARLLGSGTYNGAVDAVVVLDGVEDAVTALVHGQGHFLLPGHVQPNLPDTYIRSARTTTRAIGEDPKSVARRLVGPFLEAARQGGPDVFA